MVEAHGVDREALAHVVEEDGEGAPTPVRRSRFQNWMGADELGLVGDEVVETLVLGPEQMQPFEVRVSHAPAALLVDPETVGEDFAQRPLRIEQQRAFQLVAVEPLAECRVLLFAETERGLDRLADFTVVKPVRARGAERRIDGGAQQRDEHEIVEVASLERCVLAVVGEPEDLALQFVLDPGPLVVHPFQDRGDEDGGRGTAPLSRQAGEPVEVRTLRGGEFAAGRAEPEIPRLEPALNVA